MKKSQKIKIIFIVSTVVLVALFLVCFILSKNFKSVYDTYKAAYNSSQIANDTVEMEKAKALMDAQSGKYIVVSFLTYVFSLLGIISAGLGLKLVDKYKEKEEQEANLAVFVDESNKDIEGETQNN